MKKLRYVLIMLLLYSTLLVFEICNHHQVLLGFIYLFSVCGGIILFIILRNPEE